MSPTAAARIAFALTVALLLAVCGRPASDGAPIRVAAAADLMLAFEEASAVFAAETGERVDFIFGSTGLLAAQIRNGAPFDLFAAANVAFVEDVIAHGACDGATEAPYARGRIVTWRRGSDQEAPTLTALMDPGFSRIAIASPEHAPYGLAAKQALTSAGLWDAVRPRLVFGSNIRHAMQFAETGNAEVAIIALSLVAAESGAGVADGVGVAAGGAWRLIDEALHPPIDQSLVACRHGRRFDGGRLFASWLSSPSGRAIMQRHGFVLPGERLVATP